MSTILLIIFTSLLCTKAIVENSQLSAGSNEFGYDLLDELYINNSWSNIWISPFCISSCFALIYPGSAGNTQTQIETVMYLPTTASNASEVTQQYFRFQSLITSTYDGIPEDIYDKPSIIGIANKIYISHLLTPKPTYINALTDTITQQSFIQQNFDFNSTNATKIINKWVSQNTNKLIDNIIDENEDISDWLLVALNAIYLNGSFASPFKANMTSMHTFYANGFRNEEVSDIHLMHQKDYFEYYSDNNYQFVKFPFTDSADLFVLFALPINSQLYEQRNGLITDQNIIQNAINNLQLENIALALPKISINMIEPYELKEELQNMGMTNAFTGRADFSNIANTPLFISNVLHKTMIEMDENGLLAAAVTAIVMKYTAKPPEHAILFKADHPFQMFIIDGEHYNTILFMGQINDPGIPTATQNQTPSFMETSDPIWNNFTLYTLNADSFTTTINNDTYAPNVTEPDSAKHHGYLIFTIFVVLLLEFCL